MIIDTRTRLMSFDKLRYIMESPDPHVILHGAPLSLDISLDLLERRTGDVLFLQGIVDLLGFDSDMRGQHIVDENLIALRQTSLVLLLIMIMISSLLDNILAMDEVDSYSKLTSKARMELAFKVMLATNHTVRCQLVNAVICLNELKNLL